MVAEQARKIRAGDVAFELRRQITSERFLVNERLPPERAIAERFSVSRATVRDALRQLESSGFVQRRAGSGTYVTYSPTDSSRSVVQSTSPLELMDARYALEPQIVRLAVLHATDQSLMKAEGALAAMEACGGDANVFANADDTFHIALAECTKNSLLSWMLRQVSEVRRNAQWARMRQLTLTPRMIDVYNGHHRAVLEAIQSRDAERAARAMKQHLDVARNSLLDAAAR